MRLEEFIILVAITTATKSATITKALLVLEEREGHKNTNMWLKALQQLTAVTNF